ncbi:metal ABC transporter solute-binding protein, Zn/Mn family [Desulfobotulus mexicanus]|nr:zinc ABC transporter substrate-binding protein [Desulfobotulus mexicanus]
MIDLKRIFILFMILAVPSLSLAVQKPVVTVSILPQKHFVEKIAGDHLEVHVMVAPGASPASYEPDPSQILQLARSQVYFSIGVPFERAWLPQLARTYPGLLMVKTDEGLEKRPIAGHHHHDGHGHGKKHKHDTSFPDPHVWLSPQLVLHQINLIHSVLKEKFPSSARDFDEGYTAFVKEVMDTDTEIRSILAGKEGGSFFVFHPSWGYFAHDYGLEQIPVEVGGREPTPGELARMIRMAREKNASVVFVQPQFSDRAANIIAESVQARVVTLDPLAENWRENLLKAARAMEEHVR